MGRNAPEKNVPLQPRTLMQELAALAHQRSELLATESAIWRELSRILSNRALTPSIQQDNLKPEIPPETLLPVPRAAKYLSLSKQKLNTWRLAGAGRAVGPTACLPQRTPLSSGWQLSNRTTGFRGCEDDAM